MNKVQENSTECVLCARGLTLTSLSGRALVRDLHLAITPGTKLAVLGAEGSGKSTLLKALAGVPLPGFAIAGEISPARVGLLSQNSDETFAWPSALRYLLGRSASADGDVAWERYAAARQALVTVSLPPELLDEDRPLSTLSGGENVKLRMARLLLEDPEVLLLDEPTNYLDLPTLKWLEGFIRESARPMAFVSHDERLVEVCANRILFLQRFEYQNRSRHVFSGEGYQAFLQAKEAEYQRREARIEGQRAEARRLKKEYAEKQSQADARIRACKPTSMGEINKANRAQAKIKAELARMRARIEDTVPVEALDREEAIRIAFPCSCVVPAGKKIVEFACPKLGHGERVCATDLRLTVVGPEKIVVVGRNGVGKSTLLRRLIEFLGRYPDVRPGYLPQDASEILTDPNRGAVSYLDAAHADRTLNRTTLRRLNFEREELDRPVGQLSGGQRVKLLFARAILSGANVLLMDEPTANLSPLSSPALRAAVREYPGAVIAVSHDRAFIEAVGTVLYEMTPRGLRRKSFEDVL